MILETQVDNNDMTFAQAMFFSETTGKSIVPTRYSDEAKDTVQFYINPTDHKLYCQDYNNKAKNISISKDRQLDKWEVSECAYPKYHDTLAFKKKRYQDIALKIGISTGTIEEFLQLEKELKALGEL